MSYEISKDDWCVCKICNKTIKELAEIYGGGNIYYVQVFKKHLEQDHNTTLEEYFGPAPMCKCGVCNQTCKVNYGKGTNYKWGEWRCGRYPGTQKWSEWAKTGRSGSNNPMCGKEAWNKGKTKDNDIRMAKVAAKSRGRKASLETRKKLSDAIKRRVPPHTGHKHSEKTKNESRLRTLKMIQDGRFKQTNTKPHIKMREILDSLNISYFEEQTVEYWSFDFYIPKYNIYIEVDGDFFHSNPRRWPNGPVSKVQKINWYRDIKKNEFCQTNGMNLHRFWEHDILNNTEEVICSLKKLFQLNQ